ncbi:hypothetical protein DRQ33_02240 [bacterium]|nr:MAG: hypothetical protein DRQ33_02240 [bacterium]
MIRINLLPAELRKKKKVPFIDRTLIYGLLILVGEIILLYIISLSQQTKIAELDSEIASVQLELEKYQDQIKMQKEAETLKKELTARMNAVQELENKRAQWVKIVSELRKLIPEYVWLEKFEERSPGTFISECKGYTMKAIATYLINLMSSKTFENVEVGPISEQKIGDVSGYSFSITMNLRREMETDTLGKFVVDTAKADEISEKKHTSIVSSTREKLGLYGKEEAKKMFQGVNY